MKNIAFKLIIATSPTILFSFVSKYFAESGNNAAACAFLILGWTISLFILFKK